MNYSDTYGHMCSFGDETEAITMLTLKATALHPARKVELVKSKGDYFLVRDGFNDFYVHRTEIDFTTPL